MDETNDFEELLDRVRRKEPGAIQELIGRAHTRLCRLAAKMMNVSFSQLVGRREVDSVVSETYLRLAKALEKVDLPTPADFFRFAAFKIRQTLLDMAEEMKGPLVVTGVPVTDSSGNDLPFDRADSTLNVDTKAMWAELHREVDKLPEKVKEVFTLCYYLGLTQAQVAAVLNEHPREVSRLWFKATVKLRDFIPEEPPPKPRPPGPPKKDDPEEE